jgi:hypothetical protein
MRLFAQLTLANRADWKRVRSFIATSYTREALAVHPVARRLLDLKTTHRLHGRLRVVQGLTIQDHSVAVALKTEKSDAVLYCEMIVEEEYPHRIQRFLLAPMRPVEPTTQPAGGTHP